MSATDTGTTGCPHAQAHKARHGTVFPVTALAEFTLGPLMDALNLAEFANRADADVVESLTRTRGTFGADRPPAHAGLIRWSIDAFRNYRAAWRAHQAAVSELVPVRSAWKITHRRNAADQRRVSRYEQTCWGRRYRSVDDSVREMWLLSLSAPMERREIVTLAAANVAAFGGDGVPEKVRVVLFGATSPVVEQVVERTAAQIRDQAQDKVAPKLIEIVDGTARHPGRDCASCPDVPACPALAAADLLPDVPPAPGPRRTLSVTDLRYYRSCPAKYHLRRQLKLRDTGLVESRPVLVGRAVDETLRKRHTSGARRCRPDDAPGGDVATLLEDDRRTALEMLARHAALCPFPDVDEVPDDQHRFLVAHDSRLDVVFGGTPDLFYRRGDCWVWRETKTSRRRLRRDRSLLREVPQLALATLILSARVPEGSPRGSRIELEQLRPDGCALEEVDPTDPALVAEAREVIGELVEPVLRDTAFVPAPGADCAKCEVRRWCAPGVEYLTANRRYAS
ncbi:PD-(D/E)XK nuclease family protein [Amycolatopsis sp. cg5]|uniref:PD-(D/E)XK nuclease family protein n=1 Tax=Amycolatopsis sp. cg5 TaxID=3238802 RepID=UPI0035239458